MADKEKSGIEGRAPDPFVAARINDPAAPAPASFQLAGLLGDSDREGYRRLYLNTALDYYVEFRTADVLAVDSVNPDQAPFVGLDATQVTLNRDARVEYIHSRPAPAADAFSVDAQAGLPGGFGTDTIDTVTLPTDLTIQTRGCVPDTVLDRCLRTIQTCWTCGVRCLTQNRTCWVTGCATCFGTACQTVHNATCVTCETCQTCDQATCQTCNQATCVTCGNTCLTCNAGTCRTCNAVNCWQTVGRATCQTCQLTGCNNNCVSQLVPCVTQNRCPTLVCP